MKLGGTSTDLVLGVGSAYWGFSSLGASIELSNPGFVRTGYNCTIDLFKYVDASLFDNSSNCVTTFINVQLLILLLPVR